MNKADAKFTPRELKILFRMLLIGDSVMGMLEDFKGRKGTKYQKLMDKLFTFLFIQPETKDMITRYQGKLIPKDKIDNQATNELFDYDEISFYENLATKLGKRDFLEQASKTVLSKLQKNGYFPSSLDKYIAAYERELDEHDIRFIRAIPPDLQPKLHELVSNRNACFICGKTEKLIKTDCCGHWICDDESKYELFSYSDVSCHRNHRRFTLCGMHHAEGHRGDWQTCNKCQSFGKEDPEMYAYYGTNEYNHTTLTDIPSFEPTVCSKCKKIISRGYDPYTSLPNGKYLCVDCDTNHLQHMATN